MGKGSRVNYDYGCKKTWGVWREDFVGTEAFKLFQTPPRSVWLIEAAYGPREIPSSSPCRYLQQWEGARQGYKGIQS